MLTKTEAEDLGDLLENLGESFAIHYVTTGGAGRRFEVIGKSGFVQQVLDEMLQDANLLELALVFTGRGVGWKNDKPLSGEWAR